MLLSYHSEFLTATILQWKHLLKDDNCKQIITDSLSWLVENKKCTINAFVPIAIGMPNHIHLIWKIADGLKRIEVQGALFSFTVHNFRDHLKTNQPDLLQNYFVNDTDRTYQFWEENRW